MPCENIAQHQPDPAALDDRRRRSWIEIEDQGSRLWELVAERERGVHLERGEIGEPYQRGQVLRKAVVHVAVVATAPYRRGLHPVRAVLGAVFLVEELSVDAVGISLQRQRVVVCVGEKDRRDARVVVDDLGLGEPDLWVK